MPITIFTGLPGAGKSQKMALTFLDLLHANKKLSDKTDGDVKRKVYSNLRLSKELEEYYEGFYQYWQDPSELVKLRDCDVLWDEIATHLDSTQWQNTPLDLKRWLQQHRKFGVEIYGTTQDFAMIDKSMRRLTSALLYLTKVIGSRDRSSTRPNPKYIWGFVVVRYFDPVTYDEQNKKAVGLPSFMYISRRTVSVFDTTQEIKVGKYPSLNHIERDCDHCGTKKILHA